MNDSMVIILVESENLDNIGAVARAMKNMGFCDLRFVKSPENWEKKGEKLAMSAVDILKDSSVFSSLDEAICDISFVVGTTRRKRKKWQSFHTFSEAIRDIHRRSRRQKVAVVFGKESKGLDNRSLSLCDWTVTIPTDPAYPSINLAQAVMVIVFSLFLENFKRVSKMSSEEKLTYVTQGEIHDVLRRFRLALESLDYQYEGNDTLARIVATLHNLIKRSGLIPCEAQMLKGLARRISERASKIQQSRNRE
jgi:TrmH family RNA methyltransferase